MLETPETDTQVGKDRSSYMNGSGGGMSAMVQDFAEAVGSMATVVERQATSTARYGHSVASRLIREQPITAVAVSVGAGMLLAMLMTRSSSSRASGGYGQSWSDTADRMAASAGQMAQSVSHSAQSAVHSAREAAAPVLPAIERVVDSLSDLKAIPAPLSGLASIWQAIQGRSKS